MIITLWILLRIALILAVAFMATHLIHRCVPSLYFLGNVLKKKIRDQRLRASQGPYPVELYKWVTAGDGAVCGDCLERASWAPMDIADWMKEGLPRTLEADTACGENCRCRLILTQRRIPSGISDRD